MAARPISNASISFGLVVIPVRLFVATSSRQISFHLLHGKDNSRIQQKIYCPADDTIIDRSELVRGYEVEKGRYVTFTDEELKALEAREDHAIEIREFVPLAQVDPIFFESAYHLGCEPVAAKAYHLLAQAMAESERVAVALFTMRGKEHLVIIRPYQGGLILHTMYYADEVRAAGDIERGADSEVKESELELGKRLIADLTHDKFEPGQYHDSFRQRVIEAAEHKLAGQEVTEERPAARRGQVIDLMSALKASLEKRGAPKAEASENTSKPAKTARSRRAGGERRRAGGKK